MECTKEQVSDFHKEIDGFQKEFEKKMQIHGEVLAKSIETINSISDTDKNLAKKIENVKSKIFSEAVGTTKEIAIVTIWKHVTEFTTSHLNDYVSKFFKSLLDAKDVASQSVINAIHERLDKANDAHKTIC